MSERFVRLSDGSIVVCLDTSKPGAEYEYIRKGDNATAIRRSATGGGSMWVPPSNEEVETEIDFEEADVVRELRFRPGEKAKSSEGYFLRICGIPANCGSGDYTINIIEPTGSISSSYTINDPGLEKITSEEFKAETKRCKEEYKHSLRYRRYKSVRRSR